jgi:RNA polymerase-binding transcription factor DksA
MCNTCRTCRQKSRLVSLLNDRHNGKHVTGKYFGTRCPTIKVDASIASEANERFKRRLFHNATEIDSDIVTWPSWIDIPLPPVTKTNRKTRRANKRSNNPTNEQTTDVEEKKGSENTAIEKTIAKLVYRACSYCGGTDVPTSKCSVCKTARYCGKSCQELHWPSHKSDCTLKIS